MRSEREFEIPKINQCSIAGENVGAKQALQVLPRPAGLCDSPGGQVLGGDMDVFPPSGTDLQSLEGGNFELVSSNFAIAYRKPFYFRRHQAAGPCMIVPRGCEREPFDLGIIQDAKRATSVNAQRDRLLVDLRANGQNATPPDGGLDKPAAHNRLLQCLGFVFRRLRCPYENPPA